MNARRFIAALALVLISVTGWTQTNSLILTDDTHIADDAGEWLQSDRNYGTRPLMLVHDWGPFYALVRFDTSAIAGQEIYKATLRLYLADLRAAGSISVHAITSPWTESSVTWNTGPSYDPVAETIVEVGSADVGSVVSVDITHLAATWASGALQNHGVLLRTSEPVRAVFDTKETLGGVPAELEIMASTGPSVYAKVLDLTDPDNCPVDEPGYYVLDRDWIIGPSTEHPPYGCELRIEADVTIDFRGFMIRAAEPPLLGGFPFVTIAAGVRVTLRNGRIGYTDGYAISAPDAFVTLQRMRVSGQTLIGSGLVVSSDLSGRKDVSTLRIVDSVRVVDSLITCSVPCIETGTGPAEISGNTIIGFHYPTIVVRGPDSVVTRNNVSGAILVLTGATRSIVAWNTIGDSNFGVPGDIDVEATAVVIEGNIASGSMRFASSGNFFGNNRINGTFTGTAAQTDWGGNVSF